jgi:hypothetical protein
VQNINAEELLRFLKQWCDVQQSPELHFRNSCLSALQASFSDAKCALNQYCSNNPRVKLSPCFEDMGCAPPFRPHEVERRVCSTQACTRIFCISPDCVDCNSETCNECRMGFCSTCARTMGWKEAPCGSTHCSARLGCNWICNGCHAEDEAYANDDAYKPMKDETCVKCKEKVAAFHGYPHEECCYRMSNGMTIDAGFCCAECTIYSCAMDVGDCCSHCERSGTPLDEYSPFAGGTTHLGSCDTCGYTFCIAGDSEGCDSLSRCDDGDHGDEWYSCLGCVRQHKRDCQYCVKFG